MKNRVCRQVVIIDLLLAFKEASCSPQREALAFSPQVCYNNLIPLVASRFSVLDF
jgi:hypothetical protein